jgi:hypothetical protein
VSSLQQVESKTRATDAGLLSQFDQANTKSTTRRDTQKEVEGCSNHCQLPSVSSAQSHGDALARRSRFWNFLAASEGV